MKNFGRFFLLFLWVPISPPYSSLLFFYSAFYFYYYGKNLKVHITLHLFLVSSKEGCSMSKEWTMIHPKIILEKTLSRVLWRIGLNWQGDGVCVLKLSKGIIRFSWLMKSEVANFPPLHFIVLVLGNDLRCHSSGLFFHHAGFQGCRVVVACCWPESPPTLAPLPLFVHCMGVKFKLAQEAEILK